MAVGEHKQRSIADLLRLASAIDVRARGERGVQTDFSIRGAGCGQMLVLVDGVRINDAQSGHHNGDIPVPPHPCGCSRDQLCQHDIERNLAGIAAGRQALEQARSR